MPGNFSFNGWTTSSITPKAGQAEKVSAGLRPAVDRSLASRVVAKGATGSSPATLDQAQQAANAAAPSTSVISALTKKILGIVPKSGTNQAGKGAGIPDPVLGTLQSQGLVATAPTLRDPSLGSRVIGGSGTVGAGGIPSFITSQSNQLEGTSQIQTAQQELLDKILQQIGSLGGGGGAGAGAGGGGGGPAVDPYITAQRKREQDAKFRLQDLERQKALLGESKFGQYAGSQQESIDQELYNLYKNKTVDPTTKNPSTTWGRSAWVSPVVW